MYTTNTHSFPMFPYVQATKGSDIPWKWNQTPPGQPPAAAGTSGNNL
jgi:hypothetical protein